MEAHHGKGPMDGVGGPIKNVVLGKLNPDCYQYLPAKKCADTAHKLVPSFGYLYLPISEMMEHPTEIPNVPAISQTL